MCIHVHSRFKCPISSRLVSKLVSCLPQSDRQTDQQEADIQTNREIDTQSARLTDRRAGRQTDGRTCFLSVCASPSSQVRWSWPSIHLKPTTVVAPTPRRRCAYFRVIDSSGCITSGNSTPHHVMLLCIAHPHRLHPGFLVVNAGIEQVW